MKRDANNTRKALKSTEVDLLRIVMIKRGLSLRDLARMTGFSVEGLSTAFSMSFPCLRSRVRVEAALDLPLWSSSEQFAARRCCEARFGIDPVVATAAALVSAADRAGVDLCGARRPKSAVLRRIEEWLAVHPNFHTTSKSHNS